jgi:hypothetical protein
MARRGRSPRGLERAVPKARRNFDQPPLFPISSGWEAGLWGIVDDIFPEGPDRPDIWQASLVAVRLADLRSGRTRRAVSAVDVVESGAALATLANDVGSRVLRAVLSWGRVDHPDASLERCVKDALAGEEPSWAADALLRARLADVKEPTATREVVAKLAPASLPRMAALRWAADWSRASGDVADAETLAAEADELERQVDPTLAEARHKMNAARALWHSRPEETRQLLNDVLLLAARFRTDQAPSVLPSTLVALAWLCWNAHDREMAQSYLDRALMSMRTDDDLARSIVYTALAQTACVPGNHRAEIEWLRRWAAAERPFERIDPLMELDEALQEIGELDEAARVRDELTGLLKALPSRDRARMLDRLAGSRGHAGDRAAAFQLARQALWLGTSNEDREKSSLASFAEMWSMSATFQAIVPAGKAVGVTNTAMRPDDSAWALQAWEELRRFEEQRLGGPRTETLAALAELVRDRG